MKANCLENIGLFHLLMHSKSSSVSNSGRQALFAVLNILKRCQNAMSVSFKNVYEIVIPCHVVPGPEQAYLIIHTTICLHPFEQFLSIMQNLNKT